MAKQNGLSVLGPGVEKSCGQLHQGAGRRDRELTALPVIINVVP